MLGCVQLLKFGLTLDRNAWIMRTETYILCLSLINKSVDCRMKFLTGNNNCDCYIFYINSFSCRYLTLVTRYRERNKSSIANPTYSGNGKDDEGGFTELDCRNICERILNNLPPSWTHCWQIGITKVWQSLDFSTDSVLNSVTVMTYVMALDFYWIGFIISWKSIFSCRSNVSMPLKYVFVLQF